MKQKCTINAWWIVINKDNQILLVKEHHRKYGFPKWHAETGEHVLETAYREIQEETGLRKLLCKGYLGCICRPHKGIDFSEIKIIHFFLFYTEEKDLTPQDTVHGAEWVDSMCVPELLQHIQDKQIFVNNITR